MKNAPDTPAHPDMLQPFLIDHSHIRGKLVRLSDAAQTILSQHAYPDCVSRLLAEMLVIVSMLSSNLKSEGVLTIQASGDGPVSFMVVDATHEGHLRGYAEINETGWEQLEALSGAASAPLLSDILGQGRLAITLDQGEGEDRYQGIVELAGTSFSDAIQLYFTQSQQVEMALRLAVQKEEVWAAAGIMIERVPEEGGNAAHPEFNAAGEVEADSEEQWQRTRLFMDTVQENELLDADISGWNLLMRLFNEEGVWAYKPKPLCACCRCSRERIIGILSTIPYEELHDMLDNGRITVNCRFCNSNEYFSEAELALLDKATRTIH